MKGYEKGRAPSKKDYFSFQLAQKKDIQNVLVLCYFWSIIFIWMLTFWYVCETFCLAGLYSYHECEPVEQR